MKAVRKGALCWVCVLFSNAPSSGAEKDAREPLNPPMGVRAAPTMQTSRAPLLENARHERPDARLIMAVVGVFLYGRATAGGGRRRTEEKTKVWIQ